MKLQILILSIFLITLVESESITNATTMYSGSERTVYSLEANKKYYYTISASYNYKYTFKGYLKIAFIYRFFHIFIDCFLIACLLLIFFY